MFSEPFKVVRGGLKLLSKRRCAKFAKTTKNWIDRVAPLRPSVQRCDATFEMMLWSIDANALI